MIQIIIAIKDEIINKNYVNYDCMIDGYDLFHISNIKFTYNCYTVRKEINSF